MSVVVKGMEMPTSCAACNLDGVCKHWDIRSDRHEDCPLVPVPPHGRLIDADALIDYYKHFAGVFKGSSLPTDKARRDELLGVIGEIVNAPTIIQAEEGET